ncbi:MAG: DUF3579 domain-containing protein [Burkholderiaceae bacterium]|nr:DUF3579 domain-containing protein [Burkholderiaceae bacterium]
MTEVAPVRSFVILGLTGAGRPFRPGDWAERLCGVMAGFRPGGSTLAPHLGYSPYVMPGWHDGVKCVSVDARLYELEPLAYRFVAGFASDNALQVLWGQHARDADRSRSAPRL